MSKQFIVVNGNGLPLMVDAHGYGVREVAYVTERENATKFDTQEKARERARAQLNPDAQHFSVEEL